MTACVCRVIHNSVKLVGAADPVTGDTPDAKVKHMHRFPKPAPPPVFETDDDLFEQVIIEETDTRIELSTWLSDSQGNRRKLHLEHAPEPWPAIETHAQHEPQHEKGNSYAYYCPHRHRFNCLAVERSTDETQDPFELCLAPCHRALSGNAP